MEWILDIVLALMLALFCYTVFWTSLAAKKKGQAVVDSLFDALHAFIFVRPSHSKSKNDSGNAS